MPRRLALPADRRLTVNYGELLREEGIEPLAVLSLPYAGPYVTRVVEEYRSWLSAGYHGTMSFLDDHRDLKYDPESLVPGARALVIGALSYYTPRNPEQPSGRGIVSRYARGRDYHKEFRGRLQRIRKRLETHFTDETFRVFVDSAPVGERFYATRGGNASVGRNGMVITASSGSWVFLGGIVTTRSESEPSPIAAPQDIGSGCPDRCRRCIAACPTGALLGDGTIDSRRCISYLTIEYDGVIPEALMVAMGARVFGCDRCQEVCPLNRSVAETTVEAFRTAIAGDSVDLKEILELKTREEFESRFAGSPVMRAGRDRMVRNALIAAANTEATQLLPVVERLASDSSPIVAETAQWARKSLVDKK